MINKGVFFGIIGAFIFSYAVVNVDSLQATNNIIDVNSEYTIERLSIPKKKDLLGKYIVKNDKKSSLILNDNGTYELNINVCNNYLLLTGKYELRDTKLILKNDSTYHADLNGNEELTFTIIDSETIRVDESLVCTAEKTLFEK